MSKIEQIPIGKFSCMTRLSQKALRLYDRKGLLIPKAKDEITGYRYYTVSQIETGVKIKMLVNMGFGISEIADILKSADIGDNQIIKRLFSKRLTETQIEIQRLNKIEEILLNNDPLELLYMNCTEPVVKNTPKTRIISKREIGEYGIIIPKLIDELMRQIYLPENQREFVKITGPMMYIVHDTEFKEFDADIEVAIPITGRITVTKDEFEVKNLIAEKVISVIYTGPYDEVGIGHQKTIEYARNNGYVLTGNSREIYLNDPNSVPSDQLMTEIQQPVLTAEDSKKWN